MQLMCLCQKLILVSDQSVVCTVFTSLLKYWLGSIGILTMCSIRKVRKQMELCSNWNEFSLIFLHLNY